MKRKYKYIISERKKKYNVHFSYGIIHFWKWEKYFCISIKKYNKIFILCIFLFLSFSWIKASRKLDFLFGK